MFSVLVSKILTVLFVGSVAFWYIFTPYLVQPHKRIIGDLLSKSQLTSFQAAGEKLNDAKVIHIENWTKWRLYVRSDAGISDTTQVIYGSSEKPIFVKSKAVINMEWRSEYGVVIEFNPNLEARIDVPLLSFNKWGIYNHFFVEVEGDTVKIIPRFLFGIPHTTIESMYGVPTAGESEALDTENAKDIVGRIPIIGLFSQSNTVDRIIIQIYMGLVVCSVIVLLVVNNPRESLKTPPASKNISKPVKNE